MITWCLYGAIVTGVALAACRSPRVERSPAASRIELVATPVRTTLAYGDTFVVRAALHHRAGAPVQVAYTSTCKFALEVQGTDGASYTVARRCLLDRIAGSLARGDSLVETLRWRGGRHEPVLGTYRPDTASVSRGTFTVRVIGEVGICPVGEPGDPWPERCASRVTSAPMTVRFGN